MCSNNINAPHPDSISAFVGATDIRGKCMAHKTPQSQEEEWTGNKTHIPIPTKDEVFLTRSGESLKIRAFPWIYIHPDCRIKPGSSSQHPSSLQSGPRRCKIASWLRGALSHQPYLPSYVKSLGPRIPICTRWGYSSQGRGRVRIKSGSLDKTLGTVQVHSTCWINTFKCSPSSDIPSIHPWLPLN